MLRLGKTLKIIKSSKRNNCYFSYNSFCGCFGLCITLDKQNTSDLSAHPQLVMTVFQMARGRSYGPTSHFRRGKMKKPGKKQGAEVLAAPEAQLLFPAETAMGREHGLRRPLAAQKPLVAWRRMTCQSCGCTGKFDTCPSVLLRRYSTLTKFCLDQKSSHSNGQLCFCASFCLITIWEIQLSKNSYIALCDTLPKQHSQGQRILKSRGPNASCQQAWRRPSLSAG